MLSEDIANYFKFTSHQKQEVILTVLLPLFSGVVILIAIKPSLATETGILNLCLLGVVAILPIFLLNIIVWSILGIRFVRDIAKHCIRLSEIPDEVKDFLNSFVDDVSLSNLFGANLFRYISSVITMIASYLSACIIYFTKTSLIVAYIILLVFSILAFIIWKFFSPKIVAKIKLEDLKPFWKKVISDKEFRNDVRRRLIEIERVIKEKKKTEETR